MSTFGMIIPVVLGLALWQLLRLTVEFMRWLRDPTKVHELIRDNAVLRSQLKQAESKLDAARTTIYNAEHHWVFNAAEMMKPIVERIQALSGVASSEAHVYGSHSRPHLLWMLEQIQRGDFSATKACRWLGWVQSACVRHAITSLDEMKKLNYLAQEAQEAINGELQA